ncbi:MAG: DUF2069 domain-containing protein [Pseudomonadota bacterium]
MNETRARGFARAFWILLIGWQTAWLALLPAPLGKENPILAAVFTLPLLIPLPGILRKRERGLIWGGYLALFASMLGVVELWSVPAERPASALQVALCVGYLLFLAFATRKRKG